MAIIISEVAYEFSYKVMKFGVIFDKKFSIYQQ